jgi:tRNA (cmo5U34)-methyltransferase
LEVKAVQGDIRGTALTPDSFDVAVAGAALHHLRGDPEWQHVFSAVHESLKVGGSFWIWDLVMHQPEVLHDLMWRRYGEYLAGLKGPDYREEVFAYVEAEDTPRPLGWQLDQLHAAGFEFVEVLHKNTCFAAFGGVKHTRPAVAGG